MIPALMPTYAPSDVVFEKGEGVYLYSVDKKRYLDFAAGIAVSSLGHCHPHLVAALQEQAAKLWHISNLYRIPSQERLAQRLVDHSFADSVFFTNSGAEAVECGLKMIRKYHDDTGNPEKYRVITCRNAFHGRTLATIAAGGQQKHLQGFGPVMDGFDHVPFGNLNELRAAITAQTAAILVEPVQGEGGLHAADRQYLKGLRAVADEFGLLLMLDEVQCGMGRTGKLFAHEWADIRPDIVATAKGIGGGFPLGACLATEKAAVLGVGNHGTTYGGNPLATTVGNAVLDVILDDGFFDHVLAMGKALRAGLDDLARRFPKVFIESRGQGLMLGLKCAPQIDNRAIKKALEDEGLLIAPAGENVLRFLPPLVIEPPHIEEALTIIAAVAARQVL